MKWHVVENTPGCLPETTPVCFKSLRRAKQYAASLRQEIRNAGYKVGDDRVVDIMPCEEDCEDSL